MRWYAGQVSAAPPCALPVPDADADEVLDPTGTRESAVI